MRVLLAGATGLVGGLTLTELLSRGHEVVSLGRRKTGRTSPKLTEVVTDFSNIGLLAPAEAAVCALGTTMAIAGSKAAFRAVDYDAVLAFAAAARAAGARQFLVVSAVGANVNASAFYSRVKGEVERDVATLGFSRVDFLRPGLIIGARSERRPMEAAFQWLAPRIDPLLGGSFSRFRSISAQTIAKALANLLMKQDSGVFVHHNKEINLLAG